MSEIVLTKESSFKKIKVVDGSATDVIKQMLENGSEDRLVGTTLDGINAVTGMDASSITKTTLKRDFVDVELKGTIHDISMTREDRPADFDPVMLALKSRVESLFAVEHGVDFFLAKRTKNHVSATRDSEYAYYELIIPLAQSVSADVYSHVRTYVRQELLFPAMQIKGISFSKNYRDHKYSFTNALDLSGSHFSKYNFYKSKELEGAIDSAKYTMDVGRFMIDAEERAEKKKRKELRKARIEAKKAKGKTEGLQYDSNGDLVAGSVSNWIYMISNLSPNPLFGENELDGRSYVISNFEKTFKIGNIETVVHLKPKDFVDDNVISNVQILVEHKFGVTTAQDKFIRQAINKIAQANKFNPFLNFVRSNRWDGVHRIQNIFTDFLGAPRTDLNRWLGTSLFITSLNLLINKGMSQIVYDLIGDQGVGKTTLLEKLFLSLPAEYADENWGFPNQGWYTDQISSFDDKDSKMLMAGKLIVNDDEMVIRHLSKVDKAKKIASSDKIEFRKPYDHDITTVARTYVLTATSNKPRSVYISQNGNRKFAPVMVRAKYHTKDVFSADLTPHVVGQMWAEAYQLFLKLGARVTTYTVPSKKKQSEMEEVRQTLQYIDATTILVEKYVIDDYEKFYKTDSTEAYSVSTKKLIEVAEGYTPYKAESKISAIMEDNLGMKEIDLMYQGKLGVGFVETVDTHDKIESAKEILKARHLAAHRFTNFDMSKDPNKDDKKQKKSAK